MLKQFIPVSLTLVPHTLWSDRLQGGGAQGCVPEDHWITPNKYSSMNVVYYDSDPRWRNIFSLYPMQGGLNCWSVILFTLQPVLCTTHGTTTE